MVQEPELELKPEPEPQIVISATAQGGNLSSAPRLSALAPQHCHPHSARSLYLVVILDIQWILGLVPSASADATQVSFRWLK